eukprot:jgi/Bigna1/136832/aug1.36_g11540
MEKRAFVVLPYACFPVSKSGIVSIKVFPVSGKVVALSSEGGMTLMGLMRFKHVGSLGWFVQDSLPRMEGGHLHPETLLMKLVPGEAAAPDGETKEQRRRRIMQRKFQRELFTGDKDIVQMTRTGFEKLKGLGKMMEHKIKEMNTDKDFALKLLSNDHAKKVGEMKSAMRSLLRKKDQLIQEMQALQEKEKFRNKIIQQEMEKDNEAEIKDITKEWRIKLRDIRDELELRKDEALAGNNQTSILKNYTVSVLSACQQKKSLDETAATLEKERAANKLEHSNKDLLITRLREQISKQRQTAVVKTQQFNETMRQELEEHNQLAEKNLLTIKSMEKKATVNSLLAGNQIRARDNQIHHNEVALKDYKDREEEHWREIQEQRHEIEHLKKKVKEEKKTIKIFEEKVSRAAVETTMLKNQIEIRGEYQKVLEQQIGQMKDQQKPLREKVEELKMTINTMQAEVLARANHEMQLELQGSGQKDAIASKAIQFKQLGTMPLVFHSARK